MTGTASSSHSIGPWAFIPSSNEIVRGEERIRLEDRTARVLDLLCTNRGEVVSREAIIETVWQGRSLSDNSVAVVISDLRRVLGDDARSPRYIETLAKRGYRLMAPAPQTPAPEIPAPPPVPNFSAPPQSPWGSAIAFVLGIIVLGAFAALSSAPGSLNASRKPVPVVITVNNVSNATGDGRYNALAATVNELSAAYLTNRGNHVLIRDRWTFDPVDPSGGLYEDFGQNIVVHHLTGKIVMEGGEPVVALFVDDPQTEAMRWATTFPVSGDEISPQLHAALDDFLAKHIPN